MSDNSYKDSSWRPFLAGVIVMLVAIIALISLA